MNDDDTGGERLRLEPTQKAGGVEAVKTCRQTMGNLWLMNECGQTVLCKHCTQ